MGAETEFSCSQQRTISTPCQEQKCSVAMAHSPYVHACYTMHGKLFPMVYFLLPNKTRETYNNAFLLLKEVSQNYGFTLMPACDYELALVQSVQISFPSCDFKGCYYHFAQAIWRKVQNLGLASACRHSQSEDNKFFRKVISLPFVPVSYVRMVWDGLTCLVAKHMITLLIIMRGHGLMATLA